MRTLHVDRKAARLGLEGQALRIDLADGTIQRLPLSQLDRVVVHGDAWISAGLLRRLAAARVALVAPAGRASQDAAILWPHAGDARRRQLQHRASLEPRYLEAVAASCVRLRLAGQANMLRQARAQRPDLRLALTRGLSAVESARRKLADGASVDSARGIEGAAARSYFESYRELFATSLGFRGRHRRPPPDPVNAALSLGYGLLFGRALEVLHGSGLDAALGALHAPEHNRPSAACDLMESERHLVEAVVWKAFAKRHLGTADFSTGSDGCFLKKDGRGTYFAAINPVLGHAARRMQRRVHCLVSWLENLP